MSRLWRTGYPALLAVVILAIALSIYAGGCRNAGTSVEHEMAISSDTTTDETPTTEATKESDTDCTGCDEHATTTAKSDKADAPAATPKSESVAPTKPADKTPANTGSAPAAKPAVQTAKSLPRLVDLGSDTCTPCKLMEPILSDLKSEYKGKLHVEVIDVYKETQNAKKYGARILPTQVFFDENGKEIARHQGFISKDDILATFAKHGINLQEE